MDLHEEAKKMAKAQRLGGWMTRFKRCIDAEAGAAVSKKVIITTEQFDGRVERWRGGVGFGIFWVRVSPFVSQ
ncbi:MAG: hypothetical protein ABSF26_29580 [Thermoguttaceae bacterium]